MIRFEGVGKRYPPGIDALAGITAAIAPGEMVIVRGHSGAGKSTLLRLIAAIERPTSGSLLVNGKNLAGIGRSGIPYLRRSLGLVFQDQKLLFDRNAFENVLLPLSISGFPPAEARRRVQAALDKVGLLAREKAMPIMLSGGEQQRLAIARAVVGRPAIILADEPTAHLDAATASDIGGILQEFQRVGTTILVATYDPGPFGASRQLQLDHGRLQ